jgi:hypothetical protein
MSTNAFVYCWNPRPGLEWRAYEKSTGIISIAETREQAIAEFEKIWNFRAPIEWVHKAPPLPKREGAKPAIQGDTAAAAVYRDLVKRFHPDTHQGKRFTAGEVMAALNRLWDAMKVSA